MEQPTQTEREVLTGDPFGEAARSLVADVAVSGFEPVRAAVHGALPWSPLPTVTA